MNNKNKLIQNSCLNCDRFKKNIVELLEQYDSIYDAITDADYFIIECKKTCLKQIGD